MISVVMTYYERQFQLTKTLLSFNNSKAKFEVIIVDDNSKEDIILPEINYQCKVIKLTNKSWTNPEPVYNTGISAAKGNIIVLQNAECYHIGDVLKTAETVTDNEYISFSCFSLSKESTFNNKLPINNIGASKDGQDAWYNHPVYRPVFYDFCSAITTKNLIKLNGYDERFSFGCGYGDDYLLARIRILGLKIIPVQSPFVVHQWHYDSMVPENKGALILKNKELYQQLLRENDFRAKHIITPDL